MTTTWTSEWPTEVGTGRRWFYGWPQGLNEWGMDPPQMYLAKVCRIANGSIAALAGDFMRNAHGLWGPWVEEPDPPGKEALCHSGIHRYKASKSWDEPEEREVFGPSEEWVKSGLYWYRGATLEQLDGKDEPTS